MNRLNNKRSFTLVETLITVLLSSVVFAGIYSAYIVGNRTWTYYNDTIAARREARRAVYGMVNELRAAGNVRVVRGPKATSIHFHVPGKGAVAFIWTGPGADDRRIFRQDRYGRRVLAQDIAAVTFEKSDDAVMLDVTASKTTSRGKESFAELRERVALRSKTPYFR